MTGQTEAHLRLQECLKRLDNTRDDFRKFVERSRYVQSLRRQPFIENYIKMNSALVLEFLVGFEGMTVPPSASEDKMSSLDLAFIVFQCDGDLANVENGNQEVVLVQNVGSMGGCPLIRRK